MEGRKLCEICGHDVTTPIVVHIRRQDGVAAEYVVCSMNCEQWLWEREQGRLSKYVVKVIPYIDVPSDDTQWWDGA
jgi:hypothetical protein